MTTISPLVLSPQICDTSSPLPALTFSATFILHVIKKADTRRELPLLPETNATSLSGSKPTHSALLPIKKKKNCFWPIPLCMLDIADFASAISLFLFSTLNSSPTGSFLVTKDMSWYHLSFKNCLLNTHAHLVTAPILCSTPQLHNISLSQHLHLPINNSTHSNWLFHPHHSNSNSSYWVHQWLTSYQGQWPIIWS